MPELRFLVFDRQDNRKYLTHLRERYFIRHSDRKKANKQHITQYDQ